jgi:hypothetical protein
MFELWAGYAEYHRNLRQVQMIEGRDIILPVGNLISALDMSVASARRFWPSSVVERFGVGIGTEVLVFKDQQSADLWKTEQPKDSLIHFLISGEGLTVSIDSDPSPEIQGFVDELVMNLRVNRV